MDVNFKIIYLEGEGGFCTQNGNGCHDEEDFDYDDGDSVTDITYCCCDSDLCNGATTTTTTNGAESFYFSVLTISLALTIHSNGHLTTLVYNNLDI